MRLRRIHPEPATISPEDAFGALDLGQRAPAERPYVFCNMISTADGKATLDGRAGPIGNEADRALFHVLRTQADAVLVGATTLRVERYGRLVRDPALRERRVAQGLAADPLAVVVTHSGELGPDIPLFADPDSQIIVFTAAGQGPATSAAEVTVTRMDTAELTLPSVLARLRAEHQVRSLLCEGGPTVLGQLLADGVVDELFLALAPKLAGAGAGLGWVGGPRLVDPVNLELVEALEWESCLFLRYTVKRDTGAEPDTGTAG